MKTEGKNKTKNQNGITLIELVVTIVVLLILAGVSIALLTGDNGILTQAQNSKTASEKGEADDRFRLVANEWQIEKHKNDGQTLEDFLNSKKTANELDKVTKMADGSFVVEINGYQGWISANGEFAGEVAKPVQAGETASETEKNNYTDGSSTATIPKGFTVSATENTISTGLVVIAPDTARSEFVWVPVDSNLRAGGKLMAAKTSGTDKNGRENYQGKLYDFKGTGDATTSEELKNYGQGTTSLREPSLVTGDSKDTSAAVTSVTGTSYDAHSDYYNTILGYTSSTGAVDFGKDMQKDYNAMVESVKTYGGFYIGRYETSISGATVASTAGSTDTRPMSAATDSGNTWYGMYKKQKEYASSNTNLSSVKSSMIWGSQYDAMLNWALGGADKGKVTAKDNAPHTDLSGTYQPGTQFNDKINNIYDLEGNVREWTLEADNTELRVIRGGYCNGSLSPSLRGTNLRPGFAAVYAGSRLTLFCSNEH